MKNENKKKLAILFFVLGALFFTAEKVWAAECSCANQQRDITMTFNDISDEVECNNACFSQGSAFYKFGLNLGLGDGLKNTLKIDTTPAAASVPAAETDNTSFSYTPMEEIPGFGRPTDFPNYIGALYRFGLWTVGIAALLMISIGGYMYLTSAGNTSQTGKAKGIIADAIAGIFLALTSWLILNVINPDLVDFKILQPPMTDFGGSETPGGSGGADSSGGSGSGKCEPISSGACSATNLKNSCFGSNAQQASSICNAESGGSETIASGVDKCQPGGEAVSFGLFQINISANRIGGLNCPDAFSNPYTGSNHNCTITNRSLYNECVTAAKNPAKNIETACQLSSNGIHWSKWGANSKCGFNR